MKKQCIILGGGSKLGASLTQSFLECNYQVRLVTGSASTWDSVPGVTVIPINWHTASIRDIAPIIANLTQVDVVFFNQNSSALGQQNFVLGTPQNVSHWQQNYFVACQLPFFLVHAIKNKIHSQTKIGWMLSVLIRHPVDSQIDHADYIGNKFTNACIMKSFSKLNHGGFFGMHPDGISDDQDGRQKAKNIVNFIDNKPADYLNGRIFSHTGQVLDFE